MGPSARRLLAPLTETERRDFWEICEDRYQTRSMILTSQLPVARWHEQVGDPTVADSNGPIALFEFTGALPRARLFSQWQVSGNNQETLERLVRADFDPAQTVIVTGELPNPPTPAASNAPPGNVRIDYYAPKLVRLNAEVAAPSVLLLNDRHDPYWSVTIDGRPEPLLRCNYIMRGVYLTPGKHRVEFRFRPPLTAFYISLTGLAAGVLLCGYVVVRRDSANNLGSSGDPVRPSAKNVNRKS